MKRALIVIRLSKVTDATTSPDRQLEACRELIRSRGWVEVGVASDLDVSAGKTTPFDRPQLGDWLNNRADEFDAIVVMRMDRLVRRLFDLADVIRWCQQHGVALVSATEAFLDLSSPFGDIIALLVAKVAELELAAISERNRSAAQHNIKAGKFRGGTPPFGYAASKNSGEWRLVVDTEYRPVVDEVVNRVLAGEPLRAICADLTERGVVSPRDRVAQLQGRPVSGFAWSSSPLKRALVSQAMQGHIVSDGQVVRSEDGSPVQRAEPLVDRPVFDRLVAELESRENRKEPTKRSNSLLLRIVYCSCGEPMYKLKGGKGRVERYRCKSAGTAASCGGRSISLPEADGMVERLLDGLLGSGERRERVWVAGSDMSELDDVNATLVDLTGLLGSGVYRAGSVQRRSLDERIAALARRQQELEQQSQQPSGWQYTGTGEKFSDWWSGLSVTGKNVWLRQCGVRLVVQQIGVEFVAGDLPKVVQGFDGSVAQQWGAVLAEISAADLAGVEIGVDGSAQLHARRC